MRVHVVVDIGCLECEFEPDGSSTELIGVYAYLNDAEEVAKATEDVREHRSDRAVVVLSGDVKS